MSKENKGPKGKDLTKNKPTVKHPASQTEIESAPELGLDPKTLKPKKT